MPLVKNNRLDLSYQDLKTLDNYNLDTLNITHLEFRFNKIKELPILPESLQYLDCSNNIISHITQLPPNLKSLHCEHNKLYTIDYFPKDLTIINCSFNKLTSLPKLPDNLKRLDCMANNLTKLPELPDSIYELLCSDNPGLTIENLPTLPFNLKVFVGDIDAIRLVQFNKRLEQLGRQPVTAIPTDYQEWASIMRRKGQADRIDDLAIAFRGSGLPPYIVTQIIKEDVQVPAWSLYEIEQHVRPILYRDETTDVDYETNRVDLATGKLKPIPLPQ